MQAPLAPRWVRYTFLASLFLSALSGFAQMPIFKRYYIADVPGLGWLAEFYTTYRLHYVSAVVFIAIGFYLVMNWLLLHRRSVCISPLGYARGALLAMILATGVLLVFRNMPGYRFDPTFVVALDFSHLGLVMLFLMTTLAAKIMKRPWVVPVR